MANNPFRPGFEEGATEPIVPVRQHGDRNYSTAALLVLVYLGQRSWYPAAYAFGADEHQYPERPSLAA
jgi:hypothetical protein